MFQKYNTTIDRESAYEILQARNEEKMNELKLVEEEKQRIADDKISEKERKEQEKIRIAHEKAKEKSKKNNPLNKVAKTTLNTLTGDIGRKIARGLLGNIKKIF